MRTGSHHGHKDGTGTAQIIGRGLGMSMTGFATRLMPRIAVALFGVILVAPSPGVWADGEGFVTPAPLVDRDDHHSTGRIRTGTVWVVNRDLGELTIFDARTGEVLKQIAVGAGAHDICISERARKAYITAETINTVTTVDTRTLETNAIPVAPKPHHLEPSHDGRLVYVSLDSHPTTPTPGVAQVAVIDTDDDAVTYLATSASPTARSHGPHPSLDGDTLYVAHDTGNQVTAVDTDSHTIVRTHPENQDVPRAEEVVPTRFGHQLWASSRGDGHVYRIDLDTHTITGKVFVGVQPPVSMQPESVMLTPSERTLVVSQRATPATLAFVKTRALELRGVIQIGQTVAGQETFGDLAVMTPDGRHVYATFDAGTGKTGGVAVVDVRTRTVVDEWAYPGLGRPHGIWYSRKKLHEGDYRR
jgi:hypothetical protein